MHALFLVLASTVARAGDESPPVDPATSPVTVATTPQSPGPFTCEVDPFFVVREGEAAGLQIRLRVPEGTKLYRDQVAAEVGAAAGLVPGTLVVPEGKPTTIPGGAAPGRSSPRTWSSPSP